MSRKRALPYLVELFVEALLLALAEAIVAAVGWGLRKVLKWWKRRRDQ
jgi:hypothetical protein